MCIFYIIWGDAVRIAAAGLLFLTVKVKDNNKIFDWSSQQKRALFESSKTLDVSNALSCQKPQPGGEVAEMVNGLKSRIIAKAQAQGLNSIGAEFEPISYRSQACVSVRHPTQTPTRKTAEHRASLPPTEIFVA